MQRKGNLRQRLSALLLACCLLLGVCPTALADGEESTLPAHVIINQVYGGSNDGYASHSFIELYNPTDTAVDLSGWSIQYRSSADGDHSDWWYKLDLEGTIGAKDYVLIRCGAVTDTANVTYQVPEGNQEWDIQLHNKGLSVALVNHQTRLNTSVEGNVTGNASIIDLAACAGNDYPDETDQVPPAWEGTTGWPNDEDGLQSKKKAIRRIDFADTDDSVNDFEAVDYSKTVSQEKAPHKGTDILSTEELFTPDDLNAQPGETSVTLTWYAPEGTTSAQVKFGGTEYAAAIGEADQNGKMLCTVTVGGLTAGATYTYQVSNDGTTWSEEYTYAAPAGEPAPIVPDSGEQTKGFANGSASLDLTQIARYDSGTTNADGGVMEIVDYNSKTGFAYAVNGQSGKLAAISLSDLESGKNVAALSGIEIDVKALIEENEGNFSYGDMTSVAVSPDGTTLAAAIQAADYANRGRVAIFTCNSDGALTFQMSIEVGVQPDMVTFTPDGSKILTADEGEPREGYDGAEDPKGTVTIIDVTNSYKPQTVDFTAYDSDAARGELTAKGIVLKKNTAPSVDLEPEYIACTNTTAYVTLQEANAIAVLDIGKGVFTGIDSVGFEDYSKIAVDIDKKDEQYSPSIYESLRGIRMPDGISLVTIRDTDYLLTANEGDSREWGDYLNEDEQNFGKTGTSPTGKITADNSGLTGKVVFFDASDYDGLNADYDYLFGGRSFTLFEVTAAGLVEVFDSGNDFEAKTAAYLPSFFNCSNDDLTVDDRSGKKGPEPETVTVGEVSGRTYAFVTLERIGGVMVYDITNPAGVSCVNYINSRDFSSDVAADDSPEGLKFVSAGKSPTGKALLLAACEVGGTVAVYELTSTSSSSGTNSSGGISSGGISSSTSSSKGPYSVTVDKTAGGTVTVSLKSAFMGDTVTITIKPDAGYELDSLTVRDPDGSKLKLTDLGGGTYTFQMPGSKVEVSAAFAVARLPFLDVSQDSWCYDEVKYVYDKGLMTGTSATAFNPDGTTTRAMIVTILYRLEGAPAAGSQRFQDVPDGQHYTDAVAWATASGIVNGYGNGYFGPNDPITREQMAAILYRYASWKGCNVASRADLTRFADAGQIHSYAREALAWANAEELVNGTSTTTLTPQGRATRAQVAVILTRFIETL